MQILPQRYVTNARSGRPEAPDGWRIKGFEIWFLRGMIVLTLLVWTFAHPEPIYSWKLLAICGLAFVLNELQAAALRRRKLEFVQASQAYERTLRRAG